MKKIITLSVICLLSICLSYSQTLIAKWTFPTGSQNDSIADGGITENLNKVIKTFGGTSVIDFSKNGLTTKSAQATGWDNGNGTKYWQIEISTIGYETLTFSSKLTSGGTNPGPRDFKVQYKAGESVSWIDVSGTAITTANDWTTGALNNIVLPIECNNQSSLFIRWIMTSDFNSSGGSIASNGISKIDDININGKSIGTGINNIYLSNNISIYPNPAKDFINISGIDGSSAIKIFNTNGKMVYNKILTEYNITIQTGDLKAGLYFIEINNKYNNPKVYKCLLVK